LNKKKFINITKFSETIIKKKLNYSRVALSNLNIIRSHNEYFDSANVFKKGLIGIIKDIPNYFFNHFRYSKKISDKKVDILLISSLTSKDHINKKDIYLSHLTDEIDKTKLKYNILLRNYSANNIEKTNFHKKKIIIDNDRNFFRDFYNTLIIFYEILIIKVKIKTKNLDEKKFINNLFSLKNFSSSIHNLNEISKIKKIIKILKPKKIFFTYEGYAWERLLCYSAKQVNKKILLYGFYFSIISKYQHGPFLRLKKNFDPDYILTCGKIAKNKFDNNNFPKNKTIIIGSNRFLDKEIFLKRDKKLNILILPDGFISETIFLINFAMNCQKIDKNIRFILRLHPTLNNHLFYFKNYIKKNNIIISKLNFDKDIKRSQLAIYRSSGSIIQATAQKVIPMYIKKNNELTVDPLYELNSNKPKINNEEDFMNFYYKFKNNRNYFSNSNRKNIVKYCREYYMEADKPKIKELIHLDNT